MKGPAGAGNTPGIDRLVGVDVSEVSRDLETWLPIPGHDGYEVSDQGRVRSVSRTFVNAAGRNHRITGRVLKPILNPDGYPVVSLHGHYTVTVHKLVMLTFIGDRPPGLQVRHLDDVKTNNVLANLAYGTASENERDKIRNGCGRFSDYTHCLFGHELTGSNLVWRKRGNRECRACFVARQAATRHAGVDHAILADIYHKRILELGDRTPLFRHYELQELLSALGVEHQPQTARGLTEVTVREARRLSEEGVPTRKIAAQLGVGTSTVYFAITRRTWKDVA